VRPVIRRRARGGLAVALTSLFLGGVTAGAAGGGGPTTPGSAPSSLGSAAVTNGKLVAGAGGTYLPITPAGLNPTGGDTRSPLQVPPHGPDPQGMSCPAPNLFHLGPGSHGPGGGILAVIAIHPSFSLNKLGGYDGYDAPFGYDVRDAIPPGGDPTDNQPGMPATAANVVGHVIAVTALLRSRGTWQDAQRVAPFGGSCVGAMFSFSAPYLAGDLVPPTPPAAVLSTPPFPTGSNLVAALTGAWTIGSVDTLPGPGPTARTFVHIPTCAWTQSDVPTVAEPFHALSATRVGGYTFFLLYEVTVTPGPVTWNWGDGTSTSAAGPVERGPDSLPVYEPSTQRWTDPCQVSHAYATVSAGNTVTATETFTISITVSWSDGVAVHTQPVTCDPATGGACRLTLGPGDGWQSGPHPVDQIEPVPFAPPSPTP
jgi:hypothetical protein